MIDIPYVGSDVLGSALAMDKDKAKQIFAAHNIPVAKSEAFRVGAPFNTTEITERVKQTFKPPFVVKPNREGSTLGLTIVQSLEEVSEAIEYAAESDEVILVEDYVKGRELTVPVLGAIGKEEALPVIEIIPKNYFYDYKSKYEPGGSEHIVPADISEDLTETIQAYAVKAHQSLGCETYSRVDFLLREDGVPIILEVNTLPGMTPTSLYPDSAKKIGLSYEEMIEKLVRLSIE